MRNSLILIVLTMITTACQGPYIFNRVVNRSDGEKELLGGVDREAFKNPPFSEWFDSGYDAYRSNPEMIRQIKSKIDGYHIEAFVGSWCEDTHNQYPAFIRILDEAKFPEKKLLTYAVNRSLKSFYNEEAGKEITHVPTFIFYKGGKEVGRIVETPVSGSLEEDILMIVSGRPLKPNYAED